MEETKAKLSVINETANDATDLKTFKLHLAAYASQYVMEIAKPIMEHSEELYANPAIVILVNKWYEADREYYHKRRTYLVQWAEYDPNDKYSFEPMQHFEWASKDRKCYEQALHTLLIR